MRAIHSLGYVARGVRAWRRRPGAAFSLAVGTMAVYVLLLGVVVLVWSNAQSMVRAWELDVPVTVPPGRPGPRRRTWTWWWSGCRRCPRSRRCGA